jgi:hypothetical protein
VWDGWGLEEHASGEECLRLLPEGKGDISRLSDLLGQVLIGGAAKG